MQRDPPSCGMGRSPSLLLDVGDWPCAVVVTDGVVLATVMTNPEADPLR